MAEKLAILACDGALPVQLAAAYPDALKLTLTGVPHQLGTGTVEHPIERLGSVFAALKEAQVSRLVFAGSLARPAMDPSAFDEVMIAVAPRLLAAMQQGDDALLRQVIALFEEQGVEVVGAHDLLPELTAEEGLAIGPPPTQADLDDAARACEILKALSPLDVGQGCAVAGGQCLGIETLQGTDATLGFVAGTPATLRRGHKGIYVKAAKAGQDLRIDMPTIGPATIAAVAEAGLAGLMVDAGRVMIVDRNKTLQAVEDTGIFLIARAL
ncbi:MULTISPECIES: LpxI family protein [unclassified Roseovarius]|uniref:LpxI family protein n=1 Tax=unclassified Roseovarius TaxID=2614913 RepID=UPI00273F5C6C|nr:MULTISPECIES: UDP-2,3-diacylglucosamine diphosphatase LpxI [unclassified Roseovarius]